MEILAAKIFIEAAILCGLLRLVAKHEADYSYAKVVIISSVITTVNFFIMAISMDKIGLFVVLPMAGFAAFMLTTFCWISPKQSIVVVSAFLFVHLGLTAVGVVVDRKVNSSVEQAMDQPAERSMNETMAVLDGFYGEGTGEAVMKGGGIPILPIDEDAIAPPEEVETKPAPKPTEQPKPVKKPKPVVIKKGGGEWDEAMQMLSVGSVMTKKGITIVWINGELYETGDQVSVDYNGKTYLWELRGAKGKKLDLKQLRVR